MFRLCSEFLSKKKIQSIRLQRKLEIQLALTSPLETTTDDKKQRALPPSDVPVIVLLDPEHTNAGSGTKDTMVL
jgi:hypothetical protein